MLRGLSVRKSLVDSDTDIFAQGYPEIKDCVYLSGIRYLDLVLAAMRW